MLVIALKNVVLVVTSFKINNLVMTIVTTGTTKASTHSLLPIIPCIPWFITLQRHLLSTGWGNPCKVHADNVLISKERN